MAQAIIGVLKEAKENDVLVDSVLHALKGRVPHVIAIARAQELQTQAAASAHLDLRWPALREQLLDHPAAAHAGP